MPLRGGPPVGATPGEQLSDAGQRAESRAAALKAPPKALVTKEMLASARPKSLPNPPRSPRVSSPQVTARTSCPAAERRWKFKTSKPMPDKLFAARWLAAGTARSTRHTQAGQPL